MKRTPAARGTEFLRGQQGMSIIELLLVLVIVVVVVWGVILSVTRTGDRMFGRMDAQLASAVQAQHALTLISEDLEQAQSRTGLACGANTLTFQPVGAAQVIYFRPLVANPNDPLLRPENLLRLQGVNRQLVTSGIAGFQSNCAVPGLVAVGLSVQVGNLNPPATQTLVTKVVLQNP